jgi:general stress protein 26
MIMQKDELSETRVLPGRNAADPSVFLPGEGRVPEGSALPHAEIVHELRRLIRGGCRGVLATLDENGAACVRWMGSVTLENLREMAALTAPGSHKLAHIRRDPRVQWVFLNDETVRTITLTGKARVITDVAEMKRHWSLIPDKGRAYFLFGDLHDAGFAVIETRIERIEVCDPRNFTSLSFTPDEVEPWVSAAD